MMWQRWQSNKCVSTNTNFNLYFLIFFQCEMCFRLFITKQKFYLGVINMVIIKQFFYLGVTNKCILYNTIDVFISGNEIFCSKWTLARDNKKSRQSSDFRDHVPFKHQGKKPIEIEAVIHSHMCESWLYAGVCWDYCQKRRTYKGAAGFVIDLNKGLVGTAQNLKD